MADGSIPSSLQEKPGQTLQATALVHDAYYRILQARDEFERLLQYANDVSL